jgi:hypothetical protein
MVNHNDYYDAGFHIFGLHGAIDGACSCGNEHCKAVYKHPLISNWQHTPYWSEAQFEVMEQVGQFSTGFGVLCRGYLIIDIDPRNGGNDGYDQLVKDTGMDFKSTSGFVVATGGGGWHIYYRYDSDQPLASHHKNYKGIDFKSSGFVVGSSSMHASGSIYESESGHPDDITDLPDALRELLVKRHEEIKFHIKKDKVSGDKIRELLKYYPNTDLEYDEFIELGMIIHNELAGDGFEIWDDWAQTSSKYDNDQMDYKWHSFGKSPQPVTVGTLIKKAKDNGYIEPITFDPTATMQHATIDKFIDLTKPPGLVGECSSYINACSRFPREQLAVSASLSVIASVGGLNFVDAEFGVTPNLFTFNVAGSSTGKEAVQQAHNDLLISAGIGKTVYGAIKSDQEIYRNVLRHQPINYLIDELGIVLNKIEQASKTGSANYMGGVVGSLMSIYSKASGKLPLGADVADSILSELSKKIASINKKIDENESTQYDQSNLEQIQKLYAQIDNGYIESPCLSLAGYTTPQTFNNLVTFSQATSGFIGRALIFEEKGNNPKSKPNFKKATLSDSLASRLSALFTCGNISVISAPRLEFTENKQVIHTSDDALILLEQIQEDFHQQAESAMETNGLEAIVRRAFEQVLKVSMILAIGDGFLRTVDHVEWANALIQRDIENKINLTSANIAEVEKNLSDEVLSKVKHKLDNVERQTLGTLNAKLRTISKENIQKALDYLVSTKEAVYKPHQGKRGQPTKHYYLTK